jgi:NAD(P)-dependent dehydrogenase (short-subunit alcohol dehydrogenase family)
VSIVQSQQAQQQGVGGRQWTEADIPDLSGRTALITGANAGLGLRTAGVLAERGAHVILACRNPDKAEQAARQIAAASPAATTSVVRLDLASQASVRSAAAEIRARFPALDLLINNAGVMDVPFQLTEDMCGWARCPRCARRPTRPRGAASTTARAATGCAGSS